MDKSRWYVPVQIGLILLMVASIAVMMCGDAVGIEFVPGRVVAFINISSMLLIIMILLKNDSSVSAGLRDAFVNFIWFALGVNGAFLFVFYFPQLF